MNERLLQFIWQFQYYNKTQLTVVDGTPLTIIYQGKLNSNQGPDFSEAKIKIGNTIWAGNIEIHVRSSDWNMHNHNADANYSNIILHVVWINDLQLTDKNGEPVPTLELRPLVSKIMLQHYDQLMQSKGFVPCENHLPLLSEMGWLAWKERLVAERLQRKTGTVLKFLQQANNHWEKVFWWMLAKNFGMKVNATAFEQMAKSIPINVLAKHKYQLNQLEALFLGQSLLLNGDFKEDYPKMLQREYKFLSAKYQLKSINKEPDFLRMRPANFPTVRLVQLAALVFKSTHLFSCILEIETIEQLYELLNVTANDYWHYHYLFDEPTEYKPKNLGKTMTDNIIINTIVPVLFAYGIYHKNQQAKDKAVYYLSNLSAETNNITKEWKSKKVINKTALDSQALIELKNNYCNEKLCLNCAIGNKLLKADA
ncbi:DUF2851 family protein [Panacibacter ginsenosidivorans]|uniref:DUF2851 family protein n=1 Tax=Panacibacter ginsenosidivorans TaxID=1813871 RepID=A0A5B8V508_9BACT|nr:DUF2851 family protein [Panacibacter ginsenosidivorans]QEC66454.1 DUF2851 family protein [Panacibacter ginsenosidivorans]